LKIKKELNIMQVKVLGPGCAKCQQLEKTVREVVKEMGVDVQVEDIKDFKQIIQYPILSTPGLVIDEKLVVSGRVPTKAEVTTFITNALSKKNS
jgi:small redox-active disulfide protein 2